MTAPSLPQVVPQRTASPYTTAAPSTQHPARPASQGRLVADAPTRAFHALIALSFGAAYLTAESEHWRSLHVALGYALAGLLVLRVLYGFVGPRSAQLAPTFKKLAALPAWGRSMLQAARTLNPGAAPWQQTQHLAIAATVVSLIVVVPPLILSGLGTFQEWDAAWGGDLLSEVHEFFGEFMLGAVLLHIGLILGLSVIRRTNLARRMLSGRVPGSGPDLIRANRAWLAAVLVLATAAFVIWQAFA